MARKRLHVSLLLSLCLITLCSSSDIMIGHRHSAEGFNLGPAPFPDYKDMNFELFGSAYLEGDSVKITSPEQHQKGAIWSKTTYKLEETNDFQLDLSFRVGGVDGKFFGDGFALWFVEKSFRGMGGDALGGPDFWRGLTIFFDTFNNQHLKGKKHPYVYGIFNDGEFRYENLNNDVVNDHGCHIPMRSLEDGVLESTTVRITYRKQRVSVLIQPYDAEDWLKCFEMRNLKLPEEMSIGLTAMTGEVVDKHSMISINMYNRLTNDPWNQGIVYKQHEMPVLWEEMKHSAAIAKEFEEWEQEMEEEVDEFSLADKYADYYYFGYSYNDYYDSYYERVREFEKPSLKNNYRKDQPKGSQAESMTIELSEAEVGRIDEMIRGTAIATEIQALAEARQQRLRKLRKHMEAEFEEKVQRVNSLIKELRRKEYDMNTRIDRLANKLNIRITRAIKRADRGSSTYQIPFLMIFVIVAVGTAVGYFQYNSHMKKHLL